MRFFIYGRKSVFTGKGESVENQIEMCREYIASRFAEDAEREIRIYEDEGFSAKNTDRPQFQKMLRDLREIRPEYIVCYRLDRISRSVSDFSALIETLNQNGISFICIKEEFDTSRPMGKAMMYIASVFAQLERETIAERVRDNMLMLARGGRWLGGAPPTGYSSGKICMALPDGKIRSYCILEENPEESKAVRKIFEQYLKLRSLTGVCRALAACGALTRSGKPYTPAVVRQILKNPVYCTADPEAFSYFTRKGAEVCFGEPDFQEARGLTAYNKRNYQKSSAPRRPASEWIVAAGKHPGLISGKDWVSVQETLETASGKPHSLYSLLSGLLYCGRCGAAMYAKPRSGAKHLPSFDYICSAKLKKGSRACSCGNLNGPAADRAVLEFLTSKSFDVTTLRKRLEGMARKNAGEDAAAKRYQQEINRIEKEINALLLSLPDEGPKSGFAAYAERRINELVNNISELKRKVSRLSESGEAYRQTAQAEAVRLLDPILCLSGLSAAEQRHAVRLLCRRAVWDGSTLYLS